MKSIILLFLFFNSVSTLAALPPQFSECLYENTSTNVSSADIVEIAKISKVTYCQNQIGIVTKADTISIIKNPNVQVGISLMKTAHSFADLMDFATAGTYVLYVDSTELSRDNLISLARAGVQLVIMSATSGLTKADLLAIAAEKSFIYNVNSAVLPGDLRNYVSAGVQIVIRSSQAGLSRSDILDVALVNSERVTVMP